jgi:hypothetical protein
MAGNCCSTCRVEVLGIFRVQYLHFRLLRIFGVKSHLSFDLGRAPGGLGTVTLLAGCKVQEARLWQGPGGPRVFARASMRTGVERPTLVKARYGSRR